MMKWSKQLIPTLRENPKDAEISSHRLMMRAGMIRKLGAGLYTFLPLGNRALQKVSRIIREEMDNAGAMEILPSILIPADYWRETGRYDQMGKELFRLQDRHETDLVLGPTHEEIFTHTVRENIKSYKDFPVNLYQINTKFRDEIRPRYGIMRCREFIMKDAYSFDLNDEGLDQSYLTMRQAYQNIFTRCGLDVSPVSADTGNMGGSNSEEFMVPSEIGEEKIFKCQKCGYTANIEKAVSRKDQTVQVHEEEKTVEKISTPGIKTIEQLTEFFDLPAHRFIKTLIYLADREPVVVLISGDKNVNETKLKNALGCSELEMADEETVIQVTGAPVGFASPLYLQNVKIVTDELVPLIKNAVSGANEEDYHYQNINYPRDFRFDLKADLRNVEDGEPCPKCGAPLKSYKGIEVGHIFKLGKKYTESMNVTVQDQNGDKVHPTMGCYGIGVGRTLASVIEQNYDDNGIIWPMSVAPYHVLILKLDDDEQINEAVETLGRKLEKHQMEILTDDRQERPGVKFKDADLIGIPIQIVAGKNYLKEGLFEFKLRKDGRKEKLDLQQVIDRCVNLFQNEIK